MAPSTDGERDAESPEPLARVTSSPHNLHEIVHSRRHEYLRPRRLRVKIGSWNVAACLETEKSLAEWFVPSGTNVSPGHDGHDTPKREDTAIPHQTMPATEDPADIYFLGLQEVVDLNTTTQYISRVYASADRAVKEKWTIALEAKLPPDYRQIACVHMTGLLSLLYASPDVTSSISNVSSVSVATGFLGYLGNKGAISTRIVLGEATKLVFVNSHLASGTDPANLARRCWDVSQILSRTQFEPIINNGFSEHGDGDRIGAEHCAFWLGDLNFRLGGQLPGDDIRRLLELHTRGEFKLVGPAPAPPPEIAFDDKESRVSSMRRPSYSSDETADHTDQDSATTRSTDPDDDWSISIPDPEEYDDAKLHDDPTALQSTLNSLLAHDELQKVVKERKAFHDGWREGLINFLPTYKYDVGSIATYDTSEKRRAPGWCDRILYRTWCDQDRYARNAREEEAVRKKDAEMKANGAEEASRDEAVLFEYDPDHDGDDNDDEPRSPAGLDYYYNEDEDAPGDRTSLHHGGPSADRDPLTLNLYTSHQHIVSSDHKPLTAIFTLNYESAVPELKAKVYATAARELDRTENERRPAITVIADRPPPTEAATTDHAPATEAIIFDDIRYLDKQSSSLTLANTGHVPATISFFDDLPTAQGGGAEAGRPQTWLTYYFVRSDTAEPNQAEVGAEAREKQAIIHPGETARAVVEVCVSNTELAQLLNHGLVTLEHVLVLRVTDGRDHFVPIKGRWSPTCIGRSVDELIRVPNGGIKKFVQSLQEKPDQGNPGPISFSLGVHSAAPRELFELLDVLEALVERALADEQMLDDWTLPQDAAWPFASTSWRFTSAEARALQKVKIVDALDNNTPIKETFPADMRSPERLEVLCDVIHLFLSSLVDGLVTRDMWARIDEAALPSLKLKGNNNSNSGNNNSGNNTTLSLTLAHEDDKNTILDILSSAPNHSIAFVFLSATLAKVIAELAPLTKATLEALNTPRPSRGKRTLSFRLSSAAPLDAKAQASLEKRRALEHKVAEVFGPVVFHTSRLAKDKEWRSMEDKQWAVMELFLRRRDDG